MEMQMSDTMFDETPEAAVFFAMGAYDNLARRAVMGSRRDLTKTQADIMVGLTIYGTMNMTQISEHAAVSKEQATRAVAPLEKKGLVTRTRNPVHRRSVDVALTPEGERYLAKSQSAFIDAVKTRLEALSEEDRATLIEVSRTAASVLGKIPW